jgi:hypothetical protein
VRPLAVLAPMALLAAPLLLAGCGGAAQVEPRVCAEASVCDAGYCVAGRCRPPDALPSPLDARRLLLSPDDIAVLASGGGAPPGSLPEAVALGRASTGDVVLLLRFSASWQDDAEVASAFLVLDPVAGAQPSERRVPVEVARILEPWRSESATWGRQPRLSLPTVAALVRRSPPRPLRLDVTSLVRDWARRREDDHGIAVLAPGDDAVGAAYSMGTSDQGTGPRLEVYLR